MLRTLSLQSFIQSIVHYFKYPTNNDKTPLGKVSLLRPYTEDYIQLSKHIIPYISKQIQ